MAHKRDTVVWVQWTDTSHLDSNGWLCRKSCHFLDRPIPHCYSVGFLVANKKKHVVLAESVDECGHIAELIKIPRVNIVKMRRLKVTEHG